MCALAIKGIAIVSLLGCQGLDEPLSSSGEIANGTAVTVTVDYVDDPTPATVQFAPFVA